MKTIFVIFFTAYSMLYGQMLNKKFVVQERRIGKAIKAGEFNFAEYSVKTKEGKELYRIVDKVDYDIPFSKLEVFNDGASVLINSFYGRLTFINSTGTETKNIKIDKEMDVEYERNLFTVADDKMLLVVLANEKERFSKIKKYDKNGNFLSEFKIDFKNITGVAFSEKLNRIFIAYVIWNNSGGFKKETVVYNLTGKKIKSFNAGFEKGFFVNDKFVGYDKKSLFSVNCNSLIKDFEKHFEEIILAVTVSGFETVAVTAQPPQLKEGKWFYRNPTIIKIGEKGRIIRKEKKKTSPFSEYNFVHTTKGERFIAGTENIILN